MNAGFGRTMGLLERMNVMASSRVQPCLYMR
jgi:hypothetical protein